MLNRYAREVGDLLMKPSQTVEQSRFAGVRWTDDGNNDVPFMPGPWGLDGGVGQKACLPRIAVAAAHESTTKSDSGSRRI